ncbi:winged helix-turn-helix transcriptional regulator [Candidatus Woesearchaeota archaeon]|nr:winged helix-turn-helix transcriptional regulator [Candidatus Woesearchaeota archaeon]
MKVTEEEKIILDKNTFKALAVDTRINILKLLAGKQYTLTDLADLLKMQPSSIKEHLQVLVDANLVQQLDEGRKWKYYKLTWKGKKVVAPTEIKVYLAFVASLVAVVGSGILLFVEFFNKYSSKIFAIAAKSDAVQATAASKAIAAESAESTSQELAIEAAQAATLSVSPANYYLHIVIVVFIVSVVVLGYCLRHWIKKKRKSSGKGLRK